MTDGFQHKKSLGQNFLTSPVVPGWMCDAADVTPDDTVFEIGPGTGALTRELLARGACVHALETDGRAIAVLTHTFAEALAAGQLTLYHGDARTFPIASLAFVHHPYKVVANIPYYLSGFLLRTTLELPHPPTTLVFLMQKEVVHRITRDEKASLLSLSVAVYGEPAYIKTVSKGHFAPAPKVDSAILRVAHISHTALPTSADRTRFFAHLHLGLGQKRKQLLGCLSQVYPRTVVTDLFTALGLPATVRGEDVPLDTWLALSAALGPLPE